MKNNLNANTYNNNTYSSVFGSKGVVSGRLRWDPLSYNCQDGSRCYLFRVDTPSGQGVYLKAYVPADDTDCTLATMLRRSMPVTARYVMRTDTYRDDKGRLTKKTFLQVRELQFSSDPQLFVWTGAEGNFHGYPVYERVSESRNDRELRQEAVRK